MEDCIFCKLAQKKMPVDIVYQDEYVLAMLDIFPHAKGHTVVIPKKHVSTLEELNEEEWKNISVGLKKSLDKINEVLNPDGCNIGINNKEEAGQVVPHVHWHILPRYTGDNGGSIHSIVNNAKKEDVSKIAKLFI